MIADHFKLMLFGSAAGIVVGKSVEALKGINSSINTRFVTDSAGETVDLKPVANFPENPSQIGHIFRSRHNITDTLETRIELQNVVNQRNYLGTDVQGNNWYARINENGTQTWVSVRSGTIQNAGINRVGNIRIFNPLTGLSGR